MTKVLCAASECKHNNDNRCTLKKLSLSWCSIVTLHDGRQEFFKCKQYEMSEESQKLLEQIEKFFNYSK